MSRSASWDGPRTFQDALATLNTLQAGQKAMTVPNRVKLKFRDRMSAWIKYLDLKIERPRYIHIAGTKGKGTTCLYTEDMLRTYARASNIALKIGCLTSPHVSSVRERIRIDQEPVSEACFADNFWTLWSRMHSPGLLAETPPIPGFPSLMTLLAFHTFVQEGVDLAIIEVGMGGENDSTNVIQNPVATGITELGYDHIKQLGDTIESIAWHKAGIFKQGAPAFSVPQMQTAANVVQQRAAEKETNVTFVSDRFLKANNISVHPDEPFQRLNASLAIALAETYVAGLDPPGTITREVAQCVATTELPAKFEIFSQGKTTWVVTAGHNDMSIAAAAKSFASCFPETDDRRRILLFAHDADRSSEPFLQIIYDESCQRAHSPFDQVVFCSDVLSSVDGEGKERADLVDLRRTVDRTAALRRQHVEAWRKVTGRQSDDGIYDVPTVRQAIAQVRTAAMEGETVVLVTGSSYLAGMVRGILLGEQRAQEVE